MGDINTTTKGLGHNTFCRWADIDSCTLFWYIDQQGKETRPPIKETIVCVVLTPVQATSPRVIQSVMMFLWCISEESFHIVRAKCKVLLICICSYRKCCISRSWSDLLEFKAPFEENVWCNLCASITQQFHNFLYFINLWYIYTITFIRNWL